MSSEHAASAKQAVSIELPMSAEHPMSAGSLMSAGSPMSSEHPVKAEQAVSTDGDAGRPLIRVLIADDEALVRAGFRALVDAMPDLTVIAEAADGVAAVRECRRSRPDVVLMDIRMPVMNGLEATRLIAAESAGGPARSAGAVDEPDRAGRRGDRRDQAEAGPWPRILIITTFDDDEYVFEALRAGAAGFILKDTQPENLLAAIRTVAAGDALLAPGITRRLIAEFVRRPDPAASLGGDRALLTATLTERERAVLTHIANGYSNTEIALALYVSVSTVKTHVSHLLAKLAARDRAQLVIAAYESGLVTPGNAAE